MPIARFQMPDGRIARFEVPEGVSPEQAQVMIEQEVAKMEKPQPAPTAPTTLRDVGIAGASGALGAAKSLTDIFGADNRVSQALGSGASGLQEMYTPERKKEMEYYQNLQEQAAQKGDTLGEVGAALQGIKAAPLQSAATAIGSLIPNLATLLIPVAGEVKAAAAARSAINTAIGIAQGTGAVKGALYEGVKEELIKNGVDEKTANERASKAQEYFGASADQIIGGAVIGGAAGKFGAEELLSPTIKGAARKAIAIGSEAGTEAIQGGQEKVAENLGVQREGFDRPTFQGVAGAATQEGVLGALGAGPLTALSQSQPEKPAEVTPPPSDMGAPQLGYEPTPPTPPTTPGTPELGYEPVAKLGYDRPPEPGMPTDEELNYATATQEIEILKKQPKTKQRDARIADLTEFKKMEGRVAFSRTVAMSPKEAAAARDAGDISEFDYQRIIASHQLRDQMINNKLSKEQSDEAVDLFMAKQEEEKPKEEVDFTKEGFPFDPETAAAIAPAKSEMDALVAERQALEESKAKKGPDSLWNVFLQNKLSISEIKELEQLPNQLFALRAAGKTGRSLSDLVQEDTLDDFLPPHLRSGVEGNPDRIKEAEKHIAKKMKERNFATYDTEQKLEQLGIDINKLGEEIDYHLEPYYVNQLLNEAANEEREAAGDTTPFTSEGEDGAFKDVSGQARQEEGNAPSVGKEDLYENIKKQGSQKPEDGKWYTSDEFTAYANQPKSLKGFRKDKPSKTFEEEGYKNVQFVEVDFGDGNKIYDAIRGLNKTHTLARAFDNWTSAKRIRVLSKDEMKKLDPKLFNDVKNIMDKPGGESLFEGTDRGTRSHLFSPSEEQTKIEGELKGKSFMEMADWAIKNATNEFDKHFAQKARQRIAELQRLGLKFNFDVLTGDSRPPKYKDSTGITNFDWPTKTVTITLNGAAVFKNQDGYPSGMSYQTVLHELLHAATRAQLVSKKDSPYIKELIDLRNKVVSYYNTETRAGRTTPFMDEIRREQNNFLTNQSSVALDELLAWGITSREAQKFLSEIKVGEKNGFSKLVEIIRKVLGINKDFETALDRLIRHTNEILLEDIGNIESILIDAGVITKQARTGPAQESLFEEVRKGGEEPKGIKKAAASAAKKAKEAIHKAGQERPMDKDAFADIDDEAFMSGLEDTFNPETKTIVNKVEGMQDKFWQRLAQGIVDQYRTIKEYTEEGYMLSRLSKTVDGAVEGLLFHGHVFLNDGALDIKPNTKGLFRVMEKLGKDVDRYQMWVALNREAQLVAQGKTPSIKPELVKNRYKLAQGKIGKEDRLSVYKDVRKEMNSLNKSVLDVALKQGLIDKAAYDVFAADINYIPFYKAMEDGDVQSAATASGLGSQYFSKKLEGGEKPFGDLMENTIRNWSHILSASMKNKAAEVTLDAASSPDLQGAKPNLKVGLDWVDGKVHSIKTGKVVGDGKVKPEQTTSEGEGIIKVMKNGKPAYYKVIDPLLLDSVASIGYLGPKSKFLDVARDFKNILQYGVTLSPGFKVRNLFRDTNQAMAVSELKLDPVRNVYDNWADTDKNNPAHISALAGGAIFNFGSAYEGDQSKMVKRLIKAGVRPDSILTTPDKIKAGLLKAWDAYTELGNKSEAVNRIALYKQLRAAGKSHLEASFYARDLMDFSMQGSFPALRMVTQVVPFLNARLQGLYKLGRDGIIPSSRVLYNSVTGNPLWEVDEKTGKLTAKGEEQKKIDERKAHQFNVVTGAVMMASMMLYLAFKDDEEFKKREEWDRDNFWWFRLPGMDSAVRIPKPFEIGAFGTMAERVLEQIIDQGAEGKQFEDSIKRMLSDTFAMNPTPQMIKPMIDLYANKDSFTGAPIETAGMERLSKAERASETTSPLGKALSAVQRAVTPASMEMSPLQMDYAIKAYFGWLGGTATSASHYAVMPFAKGAYPDHDWTDTISMGFVKSLPATQSKYVTAFYENNKQISQAYADMRHYAELGESDKVREILEEKGDLIGLQKFYDQGAKDMARMRQIITSIQHNETMSGSEKKEQIDRLKLLIDMRAEQLENVRKSLKK